MRTAPPIPASPDVLFPVGLCIGVLLVLGLGLSAAVLGIQWGATEPRPDALALAWRYVNLALGAVWCLLWPAVAFAPRATPRRLPWDLATILVAMIPSAGVAAWLSDITWLTALQTLALQAGLAFLAAGLLAWSYTDGRQRLAATFLGVLYVVLPLLAYLQTEFVPALDRSWMALLPVFALAGSAGKTPANGLAVAGVYLILGAIFLALGRRRDVSKPATPPVR